MKGNVISSFYWIFQIFFKPRFDINISEREFKIVFFFFYLFVFFILLLNENKLINQFEFSYWIYSGFPIAVSYPHFLDADQQLLDAVDGLNPDRSKHESFVKIEPVSFFFYYFDKIYREPWWKCHNIYLNVIEKFLNTLLIIQMNVWFYRYT